MIRRLFAALILSLVCASPSFLLAQTAPASEPATTTAKSPAPPATAPAAPTTLASSDKLSVTSAQITLAGQALHYTTTTGYLPLKDDTAKLRANIFFIAYTKDAPAPSTLATRPVTFIFNGGPGAASVWLHLGAAGPYRVELPADATVPAPPAKLVENSSTWLADSDLVFIDPVGTGYSRAATPEQAKEFYGVSEDIASIAEFIRLYLTKYQRWESPKFLAGESYGTTRAAALAEHLHEHQGIALNGVILISTVLNFQLLHPSESNDQPYALFLPTYTATAWYHHKLEPALQQDLAKTLAEVEQFASDVYIPALAKGSALSDADRTACIEKLARYTGLSKEYITKANLRIDPSRFEHEILATQQKTVGRMDTRVAGFSPDPANDSAEFDPALSGVLPAYTSAFNQYVRNNLHYENDLPYEVLKGIPWNFGPSSPNGYLYVGDNLRNAIVKNPHLQVFVAEGYFDLATPYYSVDFSLRHLNLPPELRKNISQRYYSGGHMLYHDPKSLEKLHADLAKFFTEAAPTASR